MASLDFDAGNLLNPTKESGWGLMNPVEQEIRAKMWDLRKRLRDDPDACPIEWIIPTRLACSQRPLRDHPTFGGRRPLPPEAMPLGPSVGRARSISWDPIRDQSA